MPGLNSPSIVFYALGGGIGHFNRAVAISRILLRQGLPSLILTSTPFVAPGIQESLNILRLPSVHECEQVGLYAMGFKLLEWLQPKCLVIDTFPDGRQGELGEWLSSAVCRKILLQRDRTITVKSGIFDAICIPEPDGVGYIVNRQIHELYPRPLALKLLRASGKKPVILAVHNGSPVETVGFFRRLLAAVDGDRYDLRLGTLLQLNIPEFAHIQLSHYPISELFHGVDLVIGGAGYNLVSECLVFGKRALYYPFERPFDNQFERIKGRDYFLKTTLPVIIAEQIEHLLASPAPSPMIEGNGAERVAEILTAFS